LICEYAVNEKSFFLQCAFYLKQICQERFRGILAIYG